MVTNHGTGLPVAVLVQDLFFGSVISSAATKVGIKIVFMTPDDPVPIGVRMIVVDAQIHGDWESLTRRHVGSGGEAIAFAPHLDRHLIKRARSAGCRRVLAKSKFVNEVGAILCAGAHPGEPSIVVEESD